MTQKLFRLLPERWYLVKKRYISEMKDPLMHVHTAFADYTFLRDVFLHLEPSYFFEESIFNREYLTLTRNLHANNLLTKRKFIFMQDGKNKNLMESDCTLEEYSRSEEDTRLYGANLYFRVAAKEEGELEEFLFSLLQKLHYVDELYFPNGKAVRGGYPIPQTVQEMRFF